MKMLIAIVIGLTASPLIAHAERHALLVGVDQYEESYDPGRLYSCVNDIMGMRRCLLDDPSRWSAENTTLLSNGTATKPAIRNALDALATTAMPGDVVVYFHSSHGGQHSGTDAFLCSYDANYEDEELAADLASFADGVNVIVIIDACFSGGMYKGTSTDSSPVKPTWNFAQGVMKHYATTAKSRATKADPIAWITSCDYGELSWAGDSYSLFTEKAIYAFVHGDTSANGAVSFLELYDYAAPRTLFENPTQTVQISNGSLLGATEALAVMTGDPTVQNALDQTTFLIHSKPGPITCWFAQTGTTHDGIDAVQSGSIPDGQVSEFGIRVTEPGTLTFWWKVSSENTYDWLRFLLNGSEIIKISGDSGWEKQTIKIAPGEHTLRWIYAKDESTSEGSDCGWVDQITWTPYPDSNDPSLADSIDAAFLPATTDGNQQLWFNQALTTHDGIDAAQSGFCTNSQTSWLSTELVGPGTFSFWWRVSSEEEFDFLEFSIDEMMETRISGDVAWRQETYALGEGSHTASWCYAKDFSDFAGNDCGWVDQIVWTGSVDADGDGQNNLQEYIAGTDPTLANSTFSITNLIPMANSQIVEWPSVSGRIYNVYGTTNLMNGFHLLNTTGIEYPINSYTGTLSEVNCFYKIEVRLNQP